MSSALRVGTLKGRWSWKSSVMKGGVRQQLVGARRRVLRLVRVLFSALAVWFVFVVHGSVPSNVGIFHPPLVVVHIDLSTSVAVLQVPCAALSQTKSLSNMDYTSPVIDVIPRYIFNITVQTLSKCQKRSVVTPVPGKAS